MSDIANEIRKDLLKEDALKKATKSSWPNRFSKFFQHPATLLIIGFALTGWIGVKLTNVWQRREWDRQQLRIIELRKSELKYGILDEAARAVGERNAAVRGVLYPLYVGLDDRALQAAEVEPIKAWNKATVDWLINSQTVETKIAVHIQDHEALSCFKRIVEAEKEITGKMANVTARPWDYKDLSNDETRSYLDAIYDNLYRTVDELTKLTAIVSKEVQRDLQGQNP